MTATVVSRVPSPFPLHLW